MRFLRISVVAILASMAMAGCDEAYRYWASGPVGWALKRELRDRHSQRVALSDVTRFSWDEVFLFSPYSPRSEVCAALAIPDAQCQSLIPEESRDDGGMLLVFRQSGKIVHTELHYRYYGDFTPVPASQPISRSKAVFRVAPEGQAASGGVWLKLVLE